MPEISATLNLGTQRQDLPWKTFNLASTVTQKTSVRGAASATIYGLQPVQFLKKVVDGAKENLRFMSAVQQHVLPQGHKDVFIPKRKRFLINASWEASAAEYTTANTDMLYTDINTMNSVQLTPANTNYAVAITNDAIRTTNIPLLTYNREELSYRYAWVIDSAIKDALCGTVASSPTVPVEMSDTAQGCQTIFGGDATDAANSLNVGDILTASMIKKASKLLKSKFGYYWSSNVWTKASGTGGERKNPWVPEAGSPFILYLPPEQMANLLEDSQFTNAAEFGGNGPVLTGEIAKYAGVTLVETTNMPSFTSGDNYKVTDTTTAADVDGHICAMVKSQKAGALVMGRTLDFKTFDIPARDQVGMKISWAHNAKAIQEDAIVRLIVADLAE